MTQQQNVLVVGEGGREFAIAKKLQESTMCNRFTVLQAMSAWNL